MRELTISKGLTKTKIELFDSDRDLTIDRYTEFQCLVLEDIGVGSDVPSIGRHFQQLHTYLSANKSNQGWKEARNLHNNIYFMIEKINTQSLCFAPLIHKIDDKEPFPGFSPTEYHFDNVRKVLKDLAQKGLKQSHVTDILDEVKKNLKQSFEPIFLIDTEPEERLIYTLR